MLKDIEMEYLKGISIIELMLGAELKDDSIGHISEIKVTDGVYVGDLMNMNHVFEDFNIQVYDMYRDKELMNKSFEEKMEASYNRNKLYGFSNEMPNFKENGVCDDYQQILDLYPEMVSNESQYFIFLTPITKESQPKYGGWRWHKWGEYIGTQEPTEEYLADEPTIETVYCYRIYKLISDQAVTAKECS